mgnify:CR=1 FL=1
MSGKITDERQQMFEKSERGDKLYKLALYKNWSEGQLQKIVAVVDKYVELESENEKKVFLTQKKYNPLDFRNDLLQVGIRDDEDIFLILKALCENDAGKYRYFTECYLPTEQWSRIQAALDAF